MTEANVWSGACVIIWMHHVVYECIMFHKNTSCLIWMSHVTHMNESCHTYEWVMSHISMCDMTHWYVTRCIRCLSYSHMWYAAYMGHTWRYDAHLICMYISIHIHTHTHKYVYLYIYIRTHTNMCIHILYIHRHECTYPLHIYIYIYIYIYITFEQHSPLHFPFL